VRSNRSKKTRAVVCVSCDGDDDDDAHDARSRREGVVPFCDSAATILFLSRTRGGWWWFRTRGGERRLLLRRLAEHQHGVANDVLQRRNPWYGGTLFFPLFFLVGSCSAQSHRNAGDRQTREPSPPARVTEAARTPRAAGYDACRGKRRSSDARRRRPPR
jgi:hypothetical protein